MDINGDGSSAITEMKKIIYMSGPMVGVTTLQYLLQVVSLTMVGHVGQLQLSGASLAVSFSSVTGFSVLIGLTGALETLCGQAYGARKYQKLGSYSHAASAIVAAICIPISIIWLFSDSVLIGMGQDKAISKAAKEYAVYLIPSLFGYGMLQVLVRFFQSQGLILQMLISSLAAFCVHFPLSWFLVFKAHLGFKGAALSLSIAYWINVIALYIYMQYSYTCKPTRCPFQTELLPSTKEFLKFAIPCAIMTCVCWWSYEVIILFSGFLSNPQLETSVISICFSIAYLNYFVLFGVASIGSIRVSNELGADNPKAAKIVTKVVVGLGIVEVLIVCVPLIACRRFVGHIFSSSKEVVDYVSDVVPYLCICMVMDSLQCILNGIFRGCGWQRLGVYVNLGAYYMVGTPLAAVLAFVAHMNVKGLLIGLATGSFIQAFLLGLKTFTADWTHQAFISRERLCC